MINRFIFVSFPKSGRTWARTFIGSYLCYKNNINLSKAIEAGNCINGINSIRIEYTHCGQVAENIDGKLVLREYAKKFRVLNGKRIIYLKRSAKDVLNSYYYHLKYREKNYSGSLPNFIRNPFVGMDAYLNFNDIISKYIEKNKVKSVLYITYEDMIKDIKGSMRNLFDYIGITIDEKSFNLAYKFCEFKNLQRLEKKNFFVGGRASYSGKNESLKFRKGVIGNSAFSKKDIDYISKREQEWTTTQKDSEISPISEI